MKENSPPYIITDNMLNLATKIMKKIEEANSYPELRKKIRIRSIYSSLAIENNQLSLFEVEAVINGKSVMGEQRDIQEVKNAYKAYKEIDKINPYSIEDLKKIQGILTFAIENDSGKFRNHGEAVYDGNVQIFMAPPHTMVPTLIDNLFNWMNKAKENVNPLILSSIFHYEFVFIHPFSDGNGRTARLWQTAILAHWKDSFKYLPIENIIRKHQEGYYTAIQNCNNIGNSNEFIEFMLKIIEEAVDTIVLEQQETTQEKILDFIKKNPSITQVEMAPLLAMTRDGISYHSKALKEKGILERVGSTKNGFWKILK